MNCSRTATSVILLSNTSSGKGGKGCTATLRSVMFMAHKVSCIVLLYCIHGDFYALQDNSTT